MSDGDEQARSMADAVARRSYGKLVAFLASRTRDVAAAEDALSEAFAAALADWPVNGCPSNPEAWLLTVARRNMIDVIRRMRSGEEAAAQVRLLADGLDAATADADIPDHRLALMFACAHPAIEAGIRAPLMLQTVLGLDAKPIASAFLVSPAAMGKRLVRAKDKIRQAGIPFIVPERDELPDRLDAVLDAIYAAFAEGWSDPGGTDAARRDLTDEAMFLARLGTELLPQEPEALGLLALMLHAEARRRARRNAQGAYVPLAEQDPATWDARMIDEAEALLVRASAIGRIGRYQLEGALQSAHMHRCRTGRANWAEVVQLYGAAGARRLAGGRDQPRARHRRDARPPRRARRDAGAGRGYAARRVPALLGRARRAAGQDRRPCRRRRGLRDRDRSRARPGGAAVSAAAVRRSARSLRRRPGG